MGKRRQNNQGNKMSKNIHEIEFWLKNKSVVIKNAPMKVHFMQGIYLIKHRVYTSDVVIGSIGFSSF
jgi:hypothetical protein